MEGHAQVGTQDRRFHYKAHYPIKEPVTLKIKQPKTVDRLFVQSSMRMGQLPSNSVALMVCSPPYHVGKDYDSGTTFEDFLLMLKAVFKETWRVLVPGGWAVINVANLGRRPYVPLAAFVSNDMQSLGYVFQREVIWQKSKGASGNCAWGSWRSPSNPVIRDVHEYCLCFSKGTLDRIVGDSSITTNFEAAPTIWQIQPESASRVNHPAPFPVELPRRFIELCTNEGELVLDPFIGSGSTAIAALRSKRHWVGYEVNKEYANVALRRIELAAGVQ